jgi:hypothetical protein
VMNGDTAAALFCLLLAGGFIIGWLVHKKF